MREILITIFILMVFVSNANAMEQNFYDGNRLKTVCKDAAFIINKLKDKDITKFNKLTKRNYYNYFECKAYISAILDVKKPDPKECPLYSKYNLNRVIITVQKYLNDSPKLINLNAAVLVILTVHKNICFGKE